MALNKFFGSRHLRAPPQGYSYSSRAARAPGGIRRAVLITLVHDEPRPLWHDAFTYAISPCRPMELAGRLLSGEVTTPARPHDALARWLVTTEMASAEGPLAGSAAAERVFDKLSQRLAQLITSVGSEALLRRAVHLTRSEFPFLADVQVAPNSTRALIDRLRETAATVEPNQADEGFVAVLGTLVTLLESFIGRDLTLRVLRDVWPELPPVTQTRQQMPSRTGKLEVNP